MREITYTAGTIDDGKQLRIDCNHEENEICVTISDLPLTDKEGTQLKFHMDHVEARDIELLFHSFRMARTRGLIEEYRGRSRQDIS
jgi:hypothetical protein